MLVFKDFLFLIKLAKILSKTFLLIKKKRQIVSYRSIKERLLCFLLEPPKQFAQRTVNSVHAVQTFWTRWQVQQLGFSGRWDFRGSKQKRKRGLRDTRMKATWMSDKHKSINFIIPCLSGTRKAGCMTGISKTINKCTALALLCVTTQHKHCQQRNDLSASLVAYSGKAKALPWHILLNFDLIVPYGDILISYLNAILVVSAPSYRFLCEIYGWGRGDWK